MPNPPGSSGSLESMAPTALVQYHPPLNQQRSKSESLAPLPKYTMGIFGANFVLRK